MNNLENIIKKYNEHENRLADCIRFLTIDAVEKAKSGHPGMPMGMADFMTVLFKDFLRFNPKDPNWRNRDRLVISNGHGSMLLYSLLYLTGYEDISLDDIKNFRKTNSKTTGHPEYGILSGIEATTGPLGQGIANAVGMALSAKNSQQNISADINHKVYCTVGDGCLMEGISQEAISFAAHYELDNLIVIFDDNEISIDGKTSIASSENQADRFSAAGWEVFEIDGHNISQIKTVLSQISSNTIKKPIFIACKTIIGFGDFKNQGTSIVHGNSIDKESVLALKEAVKWKWDLFDIPSKFLSDWRGFWQRNKKFYENDQVQKIEKQVTKNAISKINHSISYLKKYHISNEIKQSTRKALGSFVENIDDLGLILYGSADLGESTCIKTNRLMDITAKSHRGNYINFGIREHAMAAIANGISLYGDRMPMITTFLAFSDYMRPAIRMSAQMSQKVLYIFTHDSILLGQDGPTHQPIEQLDSLRLIPNLNVFRPSSILELLECLEIAMLDDKPSAFILSRQDIELKISEEMKRYYESSNNSKKGGYIFEKNYESPQISILTTGSELELSQKVAKILINEHGMKTNVISIPCLEIFKKQTEIYKKEVIGQDAFVVAIELSNSNSFDIFIAKNGMKIGIDCFGKSGTMDEIISDFQITPKEIAGNIIVEFRKSF